MSRTVNVNATVNEVLAMCAKHSAGISTIEALVSGGTRVVLLNGHDAAVITRAYAGKLLLGAIRRTPLRMRS